MKCSKAGIDLIKKFESLQLKAYLCPAGVLTIGYGHTGDVARGQVITEHQANVILSLDLEKFEEGVTDLTKDVKPPLNPNEFSALVSFAFNVGIAALSKSTLLKFLLRGDRTNAADEFKRWTKAKGKELPGLIRRRADERALFLRPIN
jgi:lysozyme